VGGFVKGFFEVVGSLGELLAFGDNVTVVLNLLIGFICIGFERAACIFFFFLLGGRVMRCFWLCCGFMCQFLQSNMQWFYSNGWP
jgi:hypothetical protein